MKDLTQVLLVLNKNLLGNRKYENLFNPLTTAKNSFSLIWYFSSVGVYVPEVYRHNSSSLLYIILRTAA